MVTPELFRHYPDAQSMSQAVPEEVYEYIKSVEKDDTLKAVSSAE